MSRLAVIESMNCFVTGASGFIGANLVHELLARGHRVRALLRPNSDVRGLDGLEFERVNGDVTDRESCNAAAQGCDFHTGLRSSEPLEKVRALLRAQVPTMTGDRYFKPDIEAAIALIRHGDVIGCVAPNILPGLSI